MLFPNHNVALFDSSDVYVIGRDGNYAMLWKNGIAAKLSNGSVPAGANAVFVDNGKIYVAGFEGDKVRLWIDGVGQDLIYGTNAMSVVVKDKDIYVAGRYIKEILIVGVNSSDCRDYMKKWSFNR